MHYIEVSSFDCDCPTSSQEDFGGLDAVYHRVGFENETGINLAGCFIKFDSDFMLLITVTVLTGLCNAYDPENRNSMKVIVIYNELN